MDIDTNWTPYAEVIVIDDKGGVRFDGNFWWVYINIDGSQFDVYHTFDTKEEAEKYFDEYKKLILNLVK